VDKKSLEIPPQGLPAELVGTWISMPEGERESMSRLPTDTQASLVRAFRTRMVRVAESAKAQAAEIKSSVIQAGAPVEQLRFSFAPYPTELTRTSPFFPMSTHEMQKREYIKDMEIANHSWGTLNYSGPKLSVYEEDFLMIVLALLCDNNARILNESEGEGPITYTYVGTIRQILKLKGVENPGQNHYQAVVDALKLMAGAVFTLTTNKKVEPRAGKAASKTHYINNIITNIKYAAGSGDIEITINPFFYEQYSDGLVTWVDVRVRAKLKSLTGKALFRFIKSHRDSVWVGPLQTLAASLNMDMDLPKFKLRDRLKVAIKELVAVGQLLAISRIDKDIVYLHRSEVEPPPEGKASKSPNKRLK